MNEITRRAALKAGAATVAASLLRNEAVQAAPTWNGPPPEPDAQIRVLRWKQFVQSEFESFAANTKKFVEQTGVKVRLDAESWDDIRPKAAIAANVGAGPDIIMGTNDDPFKFPEKLLDMTDLAEYLGAKYGGWYPVTRKYGMLHDRWIALPQGSPIGTFNYRVSTMRAAGFEQFPKDTAGFLKLCQGLKKAGKPPGFALGHATGDANGWTHWCLWAHGGKVVDESNNVVLDFSRPSPPSNTPCSSMPISSMESCHGSTRATTRRFCRTRSGSPKTAFRSTPSPRIRLIPL